MKSSHLAASAVRARTSEQEEQRELLFREAYKGYLKNMCSPQAVDFRVQRILENALSFMGNNLDVEGFEKHIRTHLTAKDGQEQDFVRIRDKFFMYDTCPENCERFPVTFDDIFWCISMLSPSEDKE